MREIQEWLQPFLLLMLGPHTMCVYVCYSKEPLIQGKIGNMEVQAYVLETISVSAKMHNYEVVFWGHRDRGSLPRDILAVPFYVHVERARKG